MATSAPVIPPHQAAMQARSARLISRSLRDVDESCHALVESSGTAKRAEEERQSLNELHPEFAKADLRSVAVWWGVVFLPLAVCLIDIAMLSAVSEYLATLLFPEYPGVVLGARFLVALAVVGIDLGLALRLHDAYETAEETENRVQYYLCWLGAVAWAAFMSACLIATQQAAGAEEESSTRTLMYALAGFCFLLHLLIPYTHELLHDAKGYVVFHSRDGRFHRSIRRARHGEQEARRQSTAAFQSYARDLNRYNSQYKPALPAGPFSVRTRTVINEIFGEDTIPQPNRGPDSGAAAPNPPDPTPVAPANGGGPKQPDPPAHADAPEAENEYLRTILSRRQRDEESEVRE